MAKASRNKITIISEEIILHETNIRLSNERLKGMLSQTYEIARSDARKYKIYKYYGVFLSVAFTLLLTLLTADFRSFSKISGKCLNGIAWAVCAICFVLGSILALCHVTSHDNEVNEERDRAVEKVMRIASEDLVQKDAE